MAVKLSEEALEKLCMGFSKGSDEGFSFGPSKLAVMEENVKRAKKSITERQTTPKKVDKKKKAKLVKSKETEKQDKSKNKKSLKRSSGILKPKEKAKKTVTFALKEQTQEPNEKKIRMF